MWLAYVNFNVEFEKFIKLSHSSFYEALSLFIEKFIKVTVIQ